MTIPVSKFRNHIVQMQGYEQTVMCGSVYYYENSAVIL